MSTSPTRPPVLGAEQFAQAFPFHLHVGQDLKVLGVGASLNKVWKAGAVGLSLGELLLCKRPRRDLDYAGWLGHVGQPCVFVSRSAPKITLRGTVMLMDDGSLLLVVSPVFGRLEDIEPAGLTFNDFASHDTLGEMLLVNRAAQMTLTDAQRLAERLRLRSAQLDTIMELSSNGVAYFSPLGQVDYINSALAAMLGRERSDLLGREVRELDDMLAACTTAADPSQRVLSGLLDAHPPLAEPVTIQLDLPAKRILQVSLRASHEGGCVAYFRDVTVETEVDRMKSEFLSTAAHELRTPMASVFGFSELLLAREFAPERQREMLGTIHRQAGLLINLVNELLDLARIEARRGKDFKRRVQPIGPVVEAALAGLLVPGDARQVQATIVNPDALTWVDEEKVGQAIVNVLSNAYKYSPKGGDIRLHCSLVKGETADQIRIEVQDQGIGMTPAQLARLFERFYRADPSGNIPGTGLGMCLVREIVELHSGTVQVDSEWQAGTTVRILLPVASSMTASVTNAPFGSGPHTVPIEFPVR